MNLNACQVWIRWIGGVAALAALLIIFGGIWRGMQQPVGMTVGRAPGWLRSPLFYVVTSALFGGFCLLLWRPLPRLHQFRGAVIYRPPVDHPRAVRHGASSH